MIKNDIYTYDYFQPEEYKFSLDSVFLAQKVSKMIHHNNELHSWKVLDLCAGCGIIGLELSLHRAELMSIDFLEIQDSYRTYFERNVAMIYGENPSRQLSFLNINYAELLNPENENTYDLIVSNPPYFFQGEGLLSPSDFKNRCRFFLDSDFKTLIKAIVHALKGDKSAYLLVRKGNHHGRNPLEDIRTIIGENASAKFCDEVRGTDIIQIIKKMK
jgi:tRNA1Val (adenine37-N6)-methyltransferase